MANKKELNKSEVQKRKERVERCAQCSGAPPTKEVNLQGLIFNMCVECMEIVGDYHKEGMPIVVKEKTIVKKHYLDPDFKSSGNEEVKEIIPGLDGLEFK